MASNPANLQFQSVSQMQLQQQPARPRPLPTPPAVNNGATRQLQSSHISTSPGAGALSSTSLPTATTMQLPPEEGLGQSMLGLSLQASPPQRETRPSSAPEFTTSGIPVLVEQLPTILSLQDEAALLQTQDSDPRKEVKWIRDVLFLVNRTCISPSAAASSDPQPGPLVIDDHRLSMLAHSAIKLLLSLVPEIPPAGTKLDKPFAEALYIRATLLQSGSFPEFLPENARKAFRAFEASARAGHHASWFKLGRCYEAFDDQRRAKDCFERGVKYEDVSCLYRMGMAHLMGQLGLEVSPETAVSLLFRAAERATVVVPQPAYVYGSLLLGDFAHTSAALPPSMFASHIPPGSTIEQEAQKFIERAAYLHFTPAQYKLGYYYEFARAPYAYDPLLSVQYYTLASDAEPEACLALSKWFLCGSEGFFEKDETLARTFAERAARTGLSSAEFAMGYYWEIGIGSGKDMRKARKWYEMAAAHGNTDAADRLASLAQDEAKSLSRQDHDMLAEQTLVRRRTQAKQRSEASGSVRRTGPRENAEQVVNLVRKASRMQPRGRRGRVTGGESGDDSAGVPSMPSAVPAKMVSNENGLVDIEEIPQRHENDVTAAGAPTSNLAPSPSQNPERRRHSFVGPSPSSTSTTAYPGMQIGPERREFNGNGNGNGIATDMTANEHPSGPSPGPLLPQRREREATFSSSRSRLSLPQFPEKKRYSLVDLGPASRTPSPLPQPQFGGGGGSGSGSDGMQTPPRRYASPSPAPTNRTGRSDVGSGAASSAMPTSRTASPGVEASVPLGVPQQGNRTTDNPNAPKRVRYNTFAEMGIQGSKIEEKDCVIM